MDFDPARNERNMAKVGLPFECAADFDFDTAQRTDVPASLQAKLRSLRRPRKAPTKEQISLRVSRDVLDRFPATGSGWQGRINQALREGIERAG
jgi:uncharacterized protein (DUF4415 family)